ncbi:MAG: cobalamin B12-binding domain-containing protein [Deltaproteobacteria bacterium]|jgi:methylmalonyl-CoA mutase C-terminal domain/subunit|nr:cobalamin B12-binding domain-containing protein [Deltaproteobacteria bacterium]MBW2496224.1 cobalamin B12-binding domain-containing protein [Deltaproteobacteria bacterium]
MADRKIRVLLAKLGLDSHTVGVTVIAQSLRDAGMEVIYTGLRQTPEMVVQAAIQEDADVIGISSLSGAQMQHIPKVLERLREEEIDDKLVVVGGVIPDEDAEALTDAGVDRVFTMGARTGDIADYIREWWDQQQKQEH